MSPLRRGPGSIDDDARARARAPRVALLLLGALAGCPKADEGTTDTSTGGDTADPAEMCPGSAWNLLDLAEGRGGIAVDAASTIFTEPTIYRSRRLTRSGPAGDINGDGIDDVFVVDDGEYEYEGVSDQVLTQRGAVYVLFGSADPASRTGDELLSGVGGFVITTVLDRSIDAVRGVGDINGDGLDDLAVIAGSDRVHVVFGQTSGASVSLESVAAGLGGFVVESWYGLVSVAAIADLNDDGRDELVVGQSYFDNEYPSWDETTYVIAGRGEGAPHMLDGGPHLLTLTGAGRDLGVGDLNGDGEAELIVHSSGLGAEVVLLGPIGAGTFDVAQVGAGLPGYVIAGVGEVGFADPTLPLVRSGQDVDGDGRDDLLFEREDAIKVVFGSSSVANVDLAAAPGFEIRSSWSEPGMRATLVGDTNGDGRADLLVTTSGDLAGFAYIIEGEAGVGDVVLGTEISGASGQVLSGAVSTEYGYLALGGAAGDFDADGLADVTLVAKTLPGNDCSIDCSRVYVRYSACLY